MATYAQRAQSICGALINGTATNAQINRVGVAIARSTGREIEYNSLTDAAKATFIVQYFRSTTIALVQSTDASSAALAAAQAASGAAAGEFPEAP